MPNTTIMDFHWPQEAIEYAVKHGLNPSSGPLHISIRTHHTVSDTEIIVEDNGPGFEHAETKGTGIALKTSNKGSKTSISSALEANSPDPPSEQNAQPEHHVL